MPSLTYSATFGNQTRTVEIREVQGAWQVFLDDYYQGAVNWLGTELVMNPSHASGLQGDDIGVILEIIEGMREEKKACARHTARHTGP